MKTKKIFIYLYKTKITYIVISLIILTITVQIVDFIELTQANINKSNFSFNDIIKMSFLKMPFLINEILPFVIIISTSFYFKSLIDNNELVSIRNLGLSIFNIFYPVAFAVLSISIFSLFILNPISSISMSYLQKISDNNKKSSLIKLSNDNIWIKNKINNKVLYINAKNINIKNMLLTDIMIIDNTHNNQKLYFAEKGKINEEFILLNKVQETDIKHNKNKSYDYKNIKINFNQKDILNSLQYYKYTPFYKYYNYVNSMKKLNYLSSEIILYFLSEIFKPILLISISFVVTGYVAKFKRNENFFKTIFIAIGIGFIIFFIDKIIYSINAKNILTYIFIILAIPLTSIILGIIFMLRVEKG
tara:strand:+ start:152 stop:1234 length:1083 start_codon:yes stop_codon:yes gene_type:complete